MSASAEQRAVAVAAGILAITGEADLLRVRSALRVAAEYAGLGLTSATKLVTAGSELARNIVRYADHGQGTVSVERADDGHGRRGVRATFSDNGPGIGDLGQAMTDGFTTAGSLGLGLPGSRRLVHEFAIDSAEGRGTTVVIAQWNR
jgi:serine/threonine-protein kinase RsbT